MLQQIEYPDLIDDADMSGDEFLSPPATTLEDVEDLAPWDLTLDECVAMTLANSKVMQKLGGVVINAPAAVTTLYDQALQETNPFGSVEAALSAFDAQLSSGLSGGSNSSSSAGGFLGIPPAVPITGISLLILARQPQMERYSRFEMTSITVFHPFKVTVSRLHPPVVVTI